MEDRMKLKMFVNALKVTALIAVLVSPTMALGSDHDDGVSPLKPRNRNITDVYAFREDNQTGNSGDAENLIVIMNSNPRAPGGRQEYFDSQAKYEINFSTLAGSAKNQTPNGQRDFQFSFGFSEPDANNHQKISLKVFRRASSSTLETLGEGQLQDMMDNNRFSNYTTTLAESKAGSENMNRFRLKGGAVVEVFAGLREDPFFFDVDQFLKVRAGAARMGPKTSFRGPLSAVDFTVGYNVNTIAVRIPLSMLELPVLDIWTTVSVNGKQVERLARPAINEGLVVTNDFLNAFNMIPPSADLSAAASPVRAEAVKVLNAFDMLDGKMDIPAAVVVTAFLPDVMRIDTRTNIPIGKTAYNADLSGDKKMLTGGRKLEDDVMDITLSLLVAGDATGSAVTDNVSYAGVARNSKQGHRLLNGQSQRLGPAKFPFVAKPN